MRRIKSSLGRREVFQNDDEQPDCSRREAGKEKVGSQNQRIDNQRTVLARKLFKKGHPELFMN